MDCPACERTLQEISVAEIRVDVCRTGCGGVWFDRFELGKMDEAHESGGVRLLDYQPQVSLEVDKSARRNCPRDGAIMMRHFFSTFREVGVDTCPACAGVWLDAGELASIRTADRSDEQRAEAAKKALAQQFGDAMAAMRRESAEDRERAESVARALRWICPSYWIPGKQEGAAF